MTEFKVVCTSGFELQQYLSDISCTQMKCMVRDAIQIRPAISVAVTMLELTEPDVGGGRLHFLLQMQASVEFYTFLPRSVTKTKRTHVSTYSHYIFIYMHLTQKDV